jgi:hypothetical protein
MWPIHAVEYYLALKRKKLLTHATTWVGLEDIMLSELSQAHKGNPCVIFYTRHGEQSNPRVFYVWRGASLTHTDLQSRR